MSDTKQQKQQLPWMRLFGTDWRADPGLRMCGFGARGLWIDMITLMMEAEPYGHLLVNGKSPTPRQLAGLLGGSESEIKRLVKELEENGVFSRNEDGVIFSRRMVRDHLRAQTNRANGRNGGNPALLPNGHDPDNPGGGNSDNRKSRDTESRITDLPSRTRERTHARDHSHSQSHSQKPDPEGSSQASSPRARASEGHGGAHFPIDQIATTIGTTADQIRASGSAHVAELWRSRGVDLELDVLPVLAAKAERLRANGQGPKPNLAYYTPAIEEHHANRTAPASPPSAVTRAPTNSNRHAAALAGLLGAEAPRGGGPAAGGGAGDPGAGEGASRPALVALPGANAR